MMVGVPIDVGGIPTYEVVGPHICEGGLTTYEGVSFQIYVHPHRWDLIPADEGLSSHLRFGSPQMRVWDVGPHICGWDPHR